MNDDPASDVGYKRPPKHSRWKKGQSGNPRARRKRPRFDAIELMDKLLARKIETTFNGSVSCLTALEAIVLQLWIKAVSGDKRAEAILLRYQRMDPPKEGKRETIIIGGLSYFGRIK